MRYRLLAETLFDTRVIAVVQACARELEAEATSIERQANLVGPNWRCQASSLLGSPSNPTKVRGRDRTEDI